MEILLNHPADDIISEFAKRLAHSPDMGLEPMALRLKVWCSTDCAKKITHETHKRYRKLRIDLYQIEGARSQLLTLLIFLQYLIISDLFYLRNSWAAITGWGGGRDGGHVPSPQYFRQIAVLEEIKTNYAFLWSKLLVDFKRGLALKRREIRGRIAL